MDGIHWSGRRKRRPREHVIAEMGVNFLERQVLRRGHQLRRVPEPEYGTDARNAALLAIYQGGREWLG